MQPTSSVVFGHVIHEGCEALGIAVKFILPLAEQLPVVYDTPIPSVTLKLKSSFFEPSSLCKTDISFPLDRVKVAFLVYLLNLPLYAFPPMFNFQVINLLSQLKSHVPPYIVNLYPQLEVLFAVFVPFSHTSSVNL